MPSKFPILEMTPAKGLNTTIDPYRLSAGELQTATNIFVNQDGSLARIMGYTDKLTSDLGTGMALGYYEWLKWDGSVEKIFIYNDTLYSIDSDNITARPLFEGLVADRIMRWVPMDNYLWGGNASDENKVILPTFLHKLNQAPCDTAASTDSASAIDLLNDLRIVYIAHRLSSTVVDNTDSSAVFTGTWDTGAANIGNYKKTIRRSLTNLDDVTFTFTGTGVYWFSAKNTNRGIAKLYIDGVKITDGDTALAGDTGGDKSGVDAYGTAENQMMIYSKTGLTYASHTLKIEVTDQKNALSTDYYVVVDCFFVEQYYYHNALDSTNVITAPTCSDAATSYTLGNDIKAVFNAHRSESGIHPSADSYHLIEAADGSSEATIVALANQTKICLNQHIQDAKVHKWGITAPTTAATAADGAAGNPNGTYQLYYTFYDKVHGWESAPSPTTTDTVTNVKIELSAMDISTDPKVTHKRIYRTVDGGGIFYYENEITNVTTTYSCVATDTTLSGQVACQTEGQAVPPTTNIFVNHNGFIHMAGNLTAPYRQYFTNANSPLGYMSATNFFDYDVGITAIGVVPNGLIVSEKHKIWFVPGNSPYEMTNRQAIPDHAGVYCQEAMGNWGSTLALATGFGPFVFDGATLQPLGDKIVNNFMSKNLKNAVTVYDPINQRLWFVVASV